MPKALVLGNGNILVGFDRYGQIQDFYFPYVGMENQVSNPCAHKLGVFVDGAFSWLDDGTWNVRVDCKKETFSSIIYAVSDSLGIELEFNDVVYNEKNILVRKVTAWNKGEAVKQIKIFFHAAFELYDSERGDTVFFDPTEHAVIQYEGRRVVLMNAVTGDTKFQTYSTGVFGIERKEGTYKDAEDGILSENPVEHGRVDSVIGLSFELEPFANKTAYYWMTIGETHDEVYGLNRYVLEKTPAHIMRTTEDFWHAWVNKQNFTFYGLSDDIVRLFKKSLFYIRAHADNRGAIIASSDSDMLQYGRDTYSYMWPRDGAITALAMAKAGDEHVARRFFEFSNSVIEKGGYFMHKYRADKSWGSSWHPWIRNGNPALPIQEDETALVLFALWKHYERSLDLEFIEELYNPLIKKAANFLTSHIEEKTHLPQPSYDLWEEKFGISTFTAAAVCGALTSAGKFAELLGKKEEAERYAGAADGIQQAILKHLYDDSKKMFRKMVVFENGGSTYDDTIDVSSIYGIYRFGVLPTGDSRVEASIKTVEDELVCKTSVCGVPRYKGDAYYRVDGNVPGNPWFITTLWLAQYYIMRAQKEADLERVKETFSWVSRYALYSGILSEQLDPHTGEQLSAAPLTWSHSEFVITVIMYLEKLEELGVCKTCAPMW